MAIDLKAVSDAINNAEEQRRMDADYKRYLLYQGKLKSVIAEAIRTEFVKPETIEELMGRVIPVNITQKIVTKLAQIYNQKALREPLDGNPADQEAINLFEKSLEINLKMKTANRFFKLHKHCALEPYLNYMGIPRLRVLASHQYTLMGDDPVEPERVTTFIKHIKKDQDKRKSRHAVYTDHEFYIVDGEGRIDLGMMDELENDGVNPYGKIPFTVIREIDDSRLVPISDDDLVTMQVVICLLLTDLAFASKYQAWSVLAIKGAESEGNLTWNPSSIIDLPEGADIQVIKPEIDSDKMLTFIESLLAMLLTTKNLAVGEVSGKLEAAQAASGIAKMLDKAESTEDKQDQEAFFENGEKQLWELLAHHMLPVWIQSGDINPEYNVPFSENFELSIAYPEQRPFASDKETVELELLKLENQLTSKERALEAVHPQMSPDQIQALMDDIENEERQSMLNALSAGTQEQESQN